MSRPSMQLRFEDVYESFQVASPASPFQQQESGPGHPTIDIYGRRCLESFERLAPPMSWRRMFAASLVGMKGWFSTRCALTWKVKATKSARSYFLLQASTPLTKGKEFGFWLPTVTARCWNTGTEKERPADQPTRRSELNHLMAQEAGKASQLSPLFVEEMMGFPKGWTASPFQSGDESQ